MRSLAIFSILASMVLFLGPLLSNASPLPPNSPQDCESRDKGCTKLAGKNLSGITPEGFARAALCHENNFRADLSEGRIKPYRNDCAKKSGKLALEMWHSRAKLLFSKDVMIAEITRLKSPTYINLHDFEGLKKRYIRPYVTWIDRALAFDTIITKLDGFVKRKEGFPSNALISKVFDDREVTENTGDLEAFYDKWTNKFIDGNDVKVTMKEYGNELYAVHFHALLRQFRAHWEGQPIAEIESTAKEEENSARQGHSEAHMTESLLLRYIRVRKESKPTHELLDEEIKRLDGVEKDSQKRWERLKGLTGWLRLEYENYKKKP